MSAMEVEDKAGDEAKKPEKKDLPPPKFEIKKRDAARSNGGSRGGASAFASFNFKQRQTSIPYRQRFLDARRGRAVSFRLVR